MQILAFDTSTETLSIAVGTGGAVPRLWQHSGPGGAQASATLIPAVRALLAEAGVALHQLDAIAFGRGPGSFTGLRTACAVAQGLALGAGVPVLPVDTLLALADEARHAHGVLQVVAALDARMDEIYCARYDFAAADPLAARGFALVAPEALDVPAGWVLAGNVQAPYGSRLPAGLRHLAALPTAAAMVRLAPALLAAGQAVAPDDALPLYVRDKVALTTAERAARAAEVAGEALS